MGKNIEEYCFGRCGEIRRHQGMGEGRKCLEIFAGGSEE